jgi:hypothetical protein
MALLWITTPICFDGFLEFFSMFNSLSHRRLSSLSLPPRTPISVHSRSLLFVPYSISHISSILSISRLGLTFDNPISTKLQDGDDILLSPITTCPDLHMIISTSKINLEDKGLRICQFGSRSQVAESWGFGTFFSHSLLSHQPSRINCTIFRANTLRFMHNADKNLTMISTILISN